MRKTVYSSKKLSEALGGDKELFQDRKYLCYTVFRIKCRNATSCLDKHRKIDASNLLLRFRDVLKNNFCYLVTG